MKTIKVTWHGSNNYPYLVNRLALEIKKSGKEVIADISNYPNITSKFSIKYKAIFSPTNPMLAFLLSKELGIELPDGDDVVEYCGDIVNISSFESNEILIVSDIINTGNTREQYKDFDFACIFLKDILNLWNYGELDSPRTYYLKEIDNSTQVVMPWES